MAVKTKVCIGISGLWLSLAGGAAWAQPGPVAEIVTPEDEDRPVSDEPAAGSPAAGAGSSGTAASVENAAAAPADTVAAPAGTAPADTAPTDAAPADAAPADTAAANVDVRSEDRLPADADVAPARDAYNAGRYDDASARFLALSQRYPALPALYRALARSRAWAGDHGGAVLAYETYLAAAPEAGDREKIGAERDLARRKAEGAKGVPKAPPGAEHLDRVLPRARQGKFVGADGAFGALDAALTAGWFGPRQIEVGEQLAATLAEASRRALEAWWSPTERADAELLDQLAAAWAAQAPRRAPTPVERQLADGVQGISRLNKGEFAEAADVLAPVAPGDPRLRFAQALALVNGGRDAEAAALLDALARSQNDARVDALRGLVHNRLGNAEAGLEGLESALAAP